MFCAEVKVATGKADDIVLSLLPSLWGPREAVEKQVPFLRCGKKHQNDFLTTQGLNSANTS